MYISKVSVVNYRNFKNVCFLFSKGINTIIGENASGKTNLFRAIRFILDANMYSNAFKLNERDFNRSIGDWKGHWIIISIEFKDISDSEEIQALFSHGIGRPDVDGKKVEEASYNLFFRPNKEIREKLSCLKEGDIDSLNILLGQITIDDYETVFSGKSTADFNNPEFLIELEGDFEHVRFNNEIDQSKYGIPIPHTFSIKKEVNFTFIKAFRNVIDEFKENKTNPLLALLRYKSKEIKEDEYAEIVNTVKELNEKIGNHKDVKIINQDIIDTIMKTVGTTYSPTSIQVKANLPAEAERLLQESNARIENTIRAIKEAQAEKEKTRLVRQELNDFRASVNELASKEQEDKIARKMEKLKEKQNRKKEKKQVSESQTPSPHPPKITPITIGEHVKIKGQSAIGEVLEINGKNTAVVGFGSIKTTVKLDRLERTNAAPQKQEPAKSTFVSSQTHDQMYEKKLGFKQDIDVRGMRGDEALQAVTYFIDDAILVGMGRVRILHGTGTGILRTLIRQYLDTVPGVRHFADEHVQFGGAGITVVDLA